MAPLIEHLWQSTLVFALVWLLAWLVRVNSAALRLWLWRIAALKFLLPFSLLFALGGWVGFPVRHSAIPPPAALSEAMTSASQWTSPMQAYAFSGWTFVGSLLLVLTAATLGGWVTWHELLVAARESAAERARMPQALRRR
jgi:hypothetical protein